MKRLERNLESTTPLINSDFNDILQEQHRIAYSSYLEGINDIPQSFTQSRNRGIILSGINIDAVPTSGQGLLGGQFDWNITLDRNNSVIYFDGQYYTPSDAILDSSESSVIELTYESKGALIFYPFTQSKNDIPNNIIQLRQYQKDFKGTGAGSFGNQPVVLDYRFEIKSLREISTNDERNFVFGVTPNLQNIFPGASQGVPYVLCTWGGTSRNLSRLLKYASSVKDDIYINYEPKNWKTTLPQVVGGSVYRDWEWTLNVSSAGAFTYPTNFINARNELRGFRGLEEISGRFMVGYDSSSPTTPQNAGILQFNYGTPSNIGGTQSLTFSNAQLTTHNHGGVTSPPDRSMEHSHAILGDIVNEDHNEVFNPGFGQMALGFGKEPSGGQQQKVFFTRSIPYFTKQLETLQEDTQNPANHTHFISSIGLDLKHENRPPYTVVLYYYKM